MIRDFLRAMADRRFELGVHDCGLFVAEWVKWISGVDPAASVRGRYSTDAELMALAGPLGLPRLFDRLLTGAGLIRTEHPAIGDVAIITTADFPPRGALRIRQGFALVGEEGVARVPTGGVRVIQAWSLPPC